MYIFNYKKKIGIISICLIILSTFFLVFAIQSGLWSMIYFFISAIIFCIIMWIMALGYYSKCPHCYRWFAMKKINKELTDTWQTSVTKSQYKNGNEVYYNVPATMYLYNIHRKCKHCGNTDFLPCDEIMKN